MNHLSSLLSKILMPEGYSEAQKSPGCLVGTRDISGLLPQINALIHWFLPFFREITSMILYLKSAVLFSILLYTHSIVRIWI